MSSSDATDDEGTISEALTRYMRRRSELSEFVNCYHVMARKAVERDDGGTDLEAYERYRSQSIYFLENYIIRISDMADIYFEELIAEIAQVIPTFFDSSELERARARLTKRGLDAEDVNVRIEAARNLGRKSKPEIAERIRKQLDIDIISASAGWPCIMMCGEIRNVIVHSVSEIDSRFRDAAKKNNFEYHGDVGDPLLLPESDIIELASTVDESLSRIDQTVIKAVPILTRFEAGHFWISRSVWGSDMINMRQTGNQATEKRTV